jgi:hypothetical protein
MQFVVQIVNIDGKKENKVMSGDEILFEMQRPNAFFALQNLGRAIITRVE